jgi:hypothetical protein
MDGGENVAAQWRGHDVRDAARRGHDDKRRGRSVGEGDGGAAARWRGRDGEASNGHGGGVVVREDEKT